MRTVQETKKYNVRLFECAEGVIVEILPYIYIIYLFPTGVINTFTSSSNISGRSMDQLPSNTLGSTVNRTLSTFGGSSGGINQELWRSGSSGLSGSSSRQLTGALYGSGRELEIRMLCYIMMHCRQCDADANWC
jgi:hypothetical protein